MDEDLCEVCEEETGECIIMCKRCQDKKALLDIENRNLRDGIEYLIIGANNILETCGYKSRAEHPKCPCVGFDDARDKLAGIAKDLKCEWSVKYSVSSYQDKPEYNLYLSELNPAHYTSEKSFDECFSKIHTVLKCPF